MSTLVAKHLADYDDPDAPEVDPVAATRNLVQYLYRTGKYEQWCLDYKKNRDRYWQEIFGESYSTRQQIEPVAQVLKNPPRKGLLARFTGRAAG